MRESLAKKQERAVSIFRVLDEKYPDVGTFLDHETPFQLLIAVIMSAQCTDARVNLVTPRLFSEFPGPDELADASLEAVVECIKSVNFFNNKAKNIIETARIIRDKHNGVVPPVLDELILLPGVGRKTANVVLGQSFGMPGITVDTHVRRLVTRWGFTKNEDAVKIEYDLMKVWPKEIWSDFSSVAILHGRETCKAARPLCAGCLLAAFCPSFSVHKSA